MIESGASGLSFIQLAYSLLIREDYMNTRIRLTKTKVESLSPPAKGEKLYWDADLSGFGLRVTAKGVRSYIAQGYANGKERRVTLGKHGAPLSETETLTADRARKLAMGQIAEFSKGIDPVIEKKRVEKLSTTLHDVAQDYCKNRRTAKGGNLTEKTVTDIQRHVEFNFQDWQHQPVASITSEMCRNRFEKISKRSPAQANQAFRILRALINFSIDEENPTFNPVTTLSKKRLWNTLTPKKVFIPLDKVGRVWNRLRERSIDEALLPIGRTSADIVIFLLLTGCRWAEAAELRWGDLDLEKGSWHIADPKNHQAITLPLSAPLRAMLETRPRIEGNDYVFPARSKVGHIKRANDTMDEVSHLAGKHISRHDLRRTMIAVGIENKIELWKLKRLTNHIAQGDVTLDSYVQTNDLTYMSGEAEQIAAWIMEQGAIAAADNVVQLRGAA
jgi:integrase